MIEIKDAIKEQNAEIARLINYPQVSNRSLGDFSLLRFGYEADVKEIIIKNNSIFCEFKIIILSLHPI